MAEIIFSARLVDADILRVTQYNGLGSSLCRACDLCIAKGGLNGIICNGDRTQYYPQITVPHRNTMSLAAITRNAKCVSG